MRASAADSNGVARIIVLAAHSHLLGYGMSGEIDLEPGSDFLLKELSERKGFKVNGKVDNDRTYLFDRRRPRSGVVGEKRS